LTLVEGVIETFIAHTVETEFIIAFVEGTLHIEASTVFEDGGFALGARLREQL